MGPGSLLQRLLDYRGHLLADIDLHQLWEGVGPCLALPRTELHQILREGVPVQLGRTIRSLENLDGPVQVGFNDGSGGDYDLVVGADGLRSSVRRLAVDLRPPVPVGQGLVYAYADVTTDSEPVGDPIGRLRQRFGGFAAPVPSPRSSRSPPQLPRLVGHCQRRTDLQQVGAEDAGADNDRAAGPWVGHVWVIAAQNASASSSDSSSITMSS